MKISIFITALVAAGMLSRFNINTHSARDIRITKQDSVIVKLDSTVLVAKELISGLDVPWEIIWGPDNWIWMTQQNGTVSRLNPETGENMVLLKIADVYKKKSYGLLGFAIHPNFKKHPYIYLDYTYLKPGALIDTAIRDSSILSKLVRYTYQDGLLVSPTIIIKGIPGNTYHNGCRIIISADNKIFLTTGDAGHSNLAQDIAHLNGKILRINLDGSIPVDNPIKGSPVWSYGHRNAEGLAFGPNHILYSSENGDASDDELNIIEKQGNYGWPNVEGFCNTPGEKIFGTTHNITEPLIAWTPTIAPSGIEYYDSNKIPEWNRSIIMGTLKGNSLRILNLSENGRKVVADKAFFEGKYGRIRDVCVSPQGDIYLSTSNRDWNPSPGFPKQNDDRIIKIYKADTQPTPITQTVTANLVNKKALSLTGAVLYTSYCSSCHKPNGKGLPNTFPPLEQSSVVTGAKSTFIDIVLKGRSGPMVVNNKTYNQEMPRFKFLDDRQLALVLSYVRSNFSNHAAAISPADIFNRRKSIP